MLKDIQNFFGINKAVDISHPFFGSLSYSNEKYRNQAFWRGNIIREGQPIALKIYSSREAPADQQVMFFNETMANLDDLIEQSAKFIKESFEIWIKKSYADNFLKEFKCTSLNIPKEGNAGNDWQITFERRANKEFLFTLYIVNNRVKSTGLDYVF